MPIILSHLNRYLRPARTYYYDATAGNNANAGTSEGAPLQTIAELNARTLLPGDRVLFKRGETWATTTYTVTNSGIPGRPIIYGAYGAGALPIIRGPGGNAQAIKNLATSGKSYLHFHDLDIDGNSNANYAMHLGGHDNLVEGCTIRGALLYGLWLASTTSSFIYHTTVRGCSVTGNGQQGIYGGSGGAGQNTWHDCLIENNTVYSNGTNSGAHHGIYCSDGYGNRIRRNTCYSNAAGGIKVNDQSGTSLGGTIVEGNYCYSNDAGIVLTAYATTVRNNLLPVNTSTGIHVLGTCDSSLVLHNTMVNSGYAGIRFLDGATAITGMTIKNNLIHQDLAVVGEGKMPVRLAGDGTLLAAQNTWDNNIYCYTGAASGYVFNCQAVANKTLAGWQAFDGSPDANSLTDEPVFVTEFTDLHIQTTSPAKGAGDATVGVLTDYDGVVRGVAVDIGCFEYVA